LPGLQEPRLKSSADPFARSFAETTLAALVPTSTWTLALKVRTAIRAPAGRRQLNARASCAVSLRAITPEGKLPIRAWQPGPKRAVEPEFA